MPATADCRIDRKPPARVLEFAAFHWPASGFDAKAWPGAPGEVLRDTGNVPCLLHFAPGRWLLPAPGASAESLLDAAVRAGLGTRIDVTGKWEHIAIEGPGAARLLACAIEIQSVLAGRDCAAARLFDCPTVIARSQGGFELWLQASYAGDFLATAGRFLATLQRGP